MSTHSRILFIFEGILQVATELRRRRFSKNIRGVCKREQFHFGVISKMARKWRG
jgi:hypothetical protein